MFASLGVSVRAMLCGDWVAAVLKIRSQCTVRVRRLQQRRQSDLNFDDPSSIDRHCKTD